MIDAERPGHGRTGIVGVEKAVPYNGAATRLMRLVETAEDIGIRGVALRALVGLPNGKDHLPFLREVVLPQNPAALCAAVLLVRDTGPEGLAIARELWAGGRVTQPQAREYLDNVSLVRRER